MTRFSFCSFAILFSLTFLHAQMENAPVITAQSVEVTNSGIVYQGNAKMVSGNAVLTADEIIYRNQEQLALAKGNVILTQDTVRVLADEIDYNTGSRSYNATHLRLGQNPFYLSGNNISGDSEKITLNDAVITYTDPSPLAPTISAKSIVYSIDNETVRLNDTWIGVGPFRPIPFPSYEQSVRDIIFRYMDIEAGFGSRFGPHLDIGILAPFSPTWRLGGSVGYYMKRGLLLGPAAAYRTDNIQGSFSAGYIHDNGNEGQLGLDIQNQAIQSDRGYVDWKHRQTLSPNLTFTASVNYWSDSEITRDFRKRLFNGIQTPDNFAEFNYSQPNYVVSLFTRFRPNSYYMVQQRIPELRYDLLPMRLPLDIIQRFNSSATYLHDSSLPDIEKNRTARLDGYYSLSRPIAPTDWLTLTPVAGGRLTYYDNTNQRSHYTRALGEIGFDLEMRASGIFNYQNKRWGIDGLRHLIVPKLSYRYIPDADKGQAYIPPIDDRPFFTYLEPLSLGDRRDVDRLGRTNTLRLSLDNILQTRDPQYGSRNLLALTVAADYRFSYVPAGEKDFSNIHVGLALTPVHWFRFDLYQNISPDNARFNETGASVSIQDGQAWFARLSHSYIRADYLPAGSETAEEYYLDFGYRFNEVLQFLLRLRFDAHDSRFTEQRYVLRQNIRNLWSIDYEISRWNGNRRESSTSYSVRFNLLTF